MWTGSASVGAWSPQQVPAGASVWVGGNPVWSDWLHLTDLTGGGVPDADPNTQFSAISEPSTGVLQLTIANNGVSTDGYAEGVLWYISTAGAWDPQAVGFVDDGTFGLGFQIVVVSDPAVWESQWVGVGVLGVDTSRGSATAIEWVSGTATYRARTLNNTANNISVAGATYSMAVGTWIPDRGDTTTGGATTMSSHGATSTGDTIAASSPSQTNTSATSYAAPVLMLCAGVENTTANTRAVQVRIRYCVTRLRPKLV